MNVVPAGGGRSLPSASRPARASASCAGNDFAGWRPRQDSNLRPQDSYHFGFRRRLRMETFVVWTVPSPWAEAVRCRPSSLYTFPGFLRGLARDRPAAGAAWAFPDFERIQHGVSFRAAQFSGILCSILLSYVDLPAI